MITKIRGDLGGWMIDGGSLLCHLFVLRIEHISFSTPFGDKKTSKVTSF
jgi:hypothetical protein